MKKIGVILIFAFAVFAFIGCGDEGTSIAWKNDHTAFVEEIQWVSGGNPNQRWGGQWDPGSTTDYKEITQLTGTGDCLDDNGDLATIIIDVANSTGVKSSSAAGTTIEKDVDALLVIDRSEAK